ncbi:MAG: hypothetical protein SVU32_08985, partial [Candidatus Nanohaloarchaea archaeon]|nr:hypothetical protein [Candidatus Nanohaloarchaea archaeon]
IRVTAFSPVSWPAAAAIGTIRGSVVVTAVAVFYAVLLTLSFRPRTWRTRGELMEEDLREQ